MVMLDEGKDVKEKDGDDCGDRNEGDEHGDYSDANGDGDYGNQWSHDAGVSDTNSGGRWWWQ